MRLLMHCVARSRDVWRALSRVRLYRVKTFKGHKFHLQVSHLIRKKKKKLEQYYSPKVPPSLSYVCAMMMSQNAHACIYPHSTWVSSVFGMIRQLWSKRPPGTGSEREKKKKIRGRGVVTKWEKKIKREVVQKSKGCERSDETERGEGQREAHISLSL